MDHQFNKNWLDGVSQEHTGLLVLKKNQIYILTRAGLLYTLCYEIPCITLTFIDDYVLNINDIKEF